MAALRKVGRLSSLLLSRGTRIYSTPSRVPPPKLDIEDKPPWPELWMPGPYPKTAEERRKAAERYGLHPDEYQPHAEEDGCGDYPKLPVIGYDARDLHYPWDMPAFRRNYNEVLLEDEDIVGGDKYASMGVREHANDTKNGLIGMASFFVILAVFYFGFSETHVRLMKKHFLGEEGAKHYTFEPASK